MSSIIPLKPASTLLSFDSDATRSELELALKRVVAGEVRFDRGSRALYATDASNYRQVPIGLVVPRDADDVIATVATCKAFGAPVLPRGAGTSLAGQCCNVAVVLDFTKYMNRILEIDPVRRLARVEPGVVLDTLRNNAETYQLTFGPDPSTHNRCTLGGMIGNNSCGTHSLLAGKTVDNVEELRVLLYGGSEITVGATSESELNSIINAGGPRRQLYATLRSIRDRYGDLIRSRFPAVPRRVSGYNLDQLLPENGFNVARALVGSEGTCAVVLDATLKLIPSPQHRSLVGLGYADAYVAADHVPDILKHRPIGLEGFEGAIVDGLRRKGAPNLELLPRGQGFLLVEFGADDPKTAEHLALRLIDDLKQISGGPDVRLYNKAEARAVWKIREAGPRAAGAGPGLPPRWEGWDDAAVAPAKLGAYLRDLRKLLNEFGYEAAYYGHFGDGCIHMQTTFDLQSGEGVRKYGQFVDCAADLVVSYGGSLSGEHGDGQSRGALLPKMFGPELMQAFREFKSAWDPDNKLNPHKLVDAYLPTENLRLGAAYKPRDLQTHFQFPDDAGSFAKASLRCVGIGECRKRDNGTMCPSYMATLEEQHSTRGRARLLFELFKGDFVHGGWSDERVKEALDLCLSCKACKVECPANVDISTYRAEFLAHYYATKNRPLHAYAFGMIDRWAKVASIAPRLVNLVTRAPGFEQLLKTILQVAPQRRFPQFAPLSFRNWAKKHRVPAVGPRMRGDVGGRNTTTRHVILWVDTFNNYYHPETSRAAYEVLRHAGCNVIVPESHLCCGRPLYDFGMLEQAKAYLQRILAQLKDAIDTGVPIIVLEPSCASVFREELRNIFPRDQRADRLGRQTFLLSEFLEHHVKDYAPPQLDRRVLLHGHCHHKALMTISDEVSLLHKMGADVHVPDSGCCGMAGPFGFAKDKFDISQAIGERVLLPAIRGTDEHSLIVCDGFSCREQIEQATGRRAIHLAEAIHMALSQPPTLRTN